MLDTRKVIRAACGALLCAASVHAQFRSPPVVVAGSNLQNFLNAQGQTINVATAQRVTQGFAALNVAIPGSLLFGVHNARGPEWALSLYDVNVPSPALHQVFPSAATPGWFSMVSFRTGPPRIIVNLLDAASTPQGTSTYLTNELFAQGFAVATGGPSPAFSLDAHNPGQQPRMLLFRGTGANAGDAWLCVEIDGDNDFDDAVYRLEFFAPVPARRDSWSRVKQLFR